MDTANGRNSLDSNAFGINEFTGSQTKE